MRKTKMIFFESFRRNKNEKSVHNTYSNLRHLDFLREFVSPFSCIYYFVLFCSSWYMYVWLADWLIGWLLVFLFSLLLLQLFLLFTIAILFILSIILVVGSISAVWLTGVLKLVWLTLLLLFLLVKFTVCSLVLSISFFLSFSRSAQKKLIRLQWLAFQNGI